MCVGAHPRIPSVHVNVFAGVCASALGIHDVCEYGFFGQCVYAFVCVCSTGTHLACQKALK